MACRQARTGWQQLSGSSRHSSPRIVPQTAVTRCLLLQRGMSCRPPSQRFATGVSFLPVAACGDDALLARHVLHDLVPALVLGADVADNVGLQLLPRMLRCRNSPAAAAPMRLRVSRMLSNASAGAHLLRSCSTYPGAPCVVLRQEVLDCMAAHLSMIVCPCEVVPMLPCSARFASACL